MPLFAHWRHARVSSGAKGGWQGTFNKASAEKIDLSTTLTIKIQKIENGDDVIITDENQKKEISNKKISNKEISNKEMEITTTTKSFFCHYNLMLENELAAMHVIQRAGDKHIQSEIDRYLIASISQENSHLVLPRNSVPHYDNLPDISAYAIGILDPTMDSEPGLQQVLLLLRQCIPLRRRTKRAQREVQWREESWFAMQTLVRCMQGTLLGLYPNSLKLIAFGARTGIVRFIRTLLVLDFKKLHLCMQKIPYIVKLCIMEHLCNTIYDYHPGICHTLNQSGQKVEHFCSSVSTICDIFRGELNTLYCSAEAMQETPNSTDIIVGILTQLEKIAHSYFERCTRAYRGIIIGHVQIVRNVDHAKRLMVSSAIPHIGYLLNNIHATCSQNVFELIHAEIVPKELMELAWHINQTIQIHSLPQCVAKNQLAALGKRYSGDTTCIERCRCLYVCVQCVVKRGGAHGMRLRHDCKSGALVCINCGPGTVLSIDMLGRMVTIASDTILLSSCCGSFIYHFGSGFELKTKCGVQCIHKRLLHKKKEKNSSKQKRKRENMQHNGNNSHSSNNSSSTSSGLLDISMLYNQSHLDYLNGCLQLGNVCCVCKQKHVQQHLNLLDVKLRAVFKHGLCSKHIIPQHISKHIMDINGIEKYFQIQKYQNMNLHISENGQGCSSKSDHHATGSRNIMHTTRRTRGGGVNKRKIIFNRSDTSTIGRKQNDKDGYVTAVYKLNKDKKNDTEKKIPARRGRPPTIKRIEKDL
jgi:hypothetical protein